MNEPDSPTDPDARIDAVFEQMEQTSDTLHREHDCRLLDNRCCVRGWQQLRLTHPALAKDVELLYGRDFWTTVPETLRTLLAVFALSTGHSDLQQLAAAERGLAAARAAVEEAKVRAIKQAAKKGAG